jgi:hypothetical protein
MNKKEINPITEYLEDCIQRCQSNLDTMAVLEEVLTPFEGKQVTKRVATAIQKALPDFLVIYEKQITYFALRLYPYEQTTQGRRLNKDKGVYLSLGYHGFVTAESDGIFCLAHFKKHAEGYYLDKGRMENYKRALGKARRWLKLSYTITTSYKYLYDEMEELDAHRILDEVTGLKKA